jgi:hypothetical protein
VLPESTLSVPGMTPSGHAQSRLRWSNIALRRHIERCVEF